MQVSIHLSIQHTIHNITITQLRLWGKKAHSEVLCKTIYNLRINKKGQIVWNGLVIPMIFFSSELPNCLGCTESKNHSETDCFYPIKNEKIKCQCP